MRISDWSSDVCSSDLHAGISAGPSDEPIGRRARAVVDRDRHFGDRARTGDQDELAQAADLRPRSEEHTSELQSLMRISYAVFCLKKKKTTQTMPNANKHIRNHITQTILQE